MASISKDLLKGLVTSGFFDTWKSIDEVVTKLSQKGYSIEGKKVSLLSQLLTFLCQEEIIEREKDTDGRWKYKKVGVSTNGA